MRKKVPYIEQMEHSECGAACLAMLLCYHGYHTTLPEIRDVFGSSKKGFSLHDLIRMGSSFGLAGKAYKAEPAQLNEASLPCVLFWENKHYVILERVGKKMYTIVDPAFGRRQIAWDKLPNHYSGYLLTFHPNEQFNTRERKSGSNFLLFHILKQKNILAWIAVASLLLQGVGFIVPQLTKWIIDQVIVPANASYITTIGLGVLGLYIFHQCFSLLRSYMIARLQTKMDSSLMSVFITKLFDLPYYFFESRTSGDLVFRANSNIMIRQILSSRVISLVIDLVLIFGYAITMFCLQWQLSLLVITLSIFVVAALMISSQWIKRLSDQNIAVQSKTQSYLTESIYGICDIKVLGIEKKIFKHWQGLFHEQLAIAQRQSMLSSFLDTFGSGIQLITPLTLLWLGSGMVLNKELTLGGLLGFTALATSFIVPILSMSTTYSHFLILGSYIQRLQDVMDSKPENKNGIGLEQLKGTIELKNVSFRYDSFGSDILSDINLTIKSGEKVAIVGESGSGKSTLSKLLLGLYSPSKGCIHFDNVPLEQLDLQWLRSQMGAVLQETRLFHGTILENIQHLDDKLSIEQVAAAAHVADIHEEILKQPMSYFTMISEAGSNFSGGQRQRLLLARALVTQPKILILDEATSALDNLSESRIQGNLQELECTQIIVAHRLSTIVDADRIVLLKNGRIQEIGNHQELMSKRGVYYHLYTVQGENENEEMVI
ncbi:peptidase domain-containing ABC transporter [Aneurinibacillus tyrosinisolvens]|uniref:peptidase domain-containing ABC transporter n=1 Tax=Aneurinibacillus tyrosinisolvens TaxID=1443435 RepID=UPI00069A42E2|nr:peptidase domain-containing ABC transporter [Aneurinibacillus tyrosinisolvens]